MERGMSFLIQNQCSHVISETNHHSPQYHHHCRRRPCYHRHCRSGTCLRQNLHCKPPSRSQKANRSNSVTIIIVYFRCHCRCLCVFGVWMGESVGSEWWRTKLHVIHKLSWWNIIQGYHNDVIFAPWRLHHRQPNFTFHSLFMLITKKILKLHITRRCEGNSPVTGGSR